MLVDLVWLTTTNHMFGSGNFGDESTSWFFKIFKNALGQFIPNRPPKHVITSTNISAQWNQQLMRNVFSNVIECLEQSIWKINRLQKTIENKRNEQSKKRLDMLNCIACMLKTCYRANVPYILRRSGSNEPCVLSCSRDNEPCLF